MYIAFRTSAAKKKKKNKNKIAVYVDLTYDNSTLANNLHVSQVSDMMCVHVGIEYSLQILKENLVRKVIVANSSDYTAQCSLHAIITCEVSTNPKCSRI